MSRVEGTECHCICHRNDRVRHCFPCCTKCSRCWRFIKHGSYDAHKKEHEESDARLGIVDPDKCSHSAESFKRWDFDGGGWSRNCGVCGKFIEGDLKSGGVG